MNNKYKIVKSKSGKSKKKVINGVKKVLYKKEGSNKLYVATKGKMMNVVKYRKLKEKKSTSQTKKKIKLTKKR